LKRRTAFIKRTPFRPRWPRDPTRASRRQRSSGAPAGVTFTRAGLAGGELDPGSVSPTGYAWLGSLALVSTVGAIALFLARLRRVGPAAASILFTLEPVVTVALAFVVFSEALGPAQLAGGALVLSAVVAVRAS
jgi:drug/metabolite transporter (DMT)-like permease